MRQVNERETDYKAHTMRVVRGKKNIPFLTPHLLECIGNIERADLLVILELEEFVPSVASHIDENVGTIICEKAFGARNG